MTLPGSVFNNVVYFLCANVNVVTADEALFIHLKSVWGEAFPGYNKFFRCFLKRIWELKIQDLQGI